MFIFNLDVNQPTLVETEILLSVLWKIYIVIDAAL